MHKKGRRKNINRKGKQKQKYKEATFTQRRNQQVNRRHIKITYLLTALEPARGPLAISPHKTNCQRQTDRTVIAHEFMQQNALFTETLLLGRMTTSPWSIVSMSFSHFLKSTL